MVDIVREGWTSVAECTLLANESSDEKARRFFLKLAKSWRQVALSYEELARSDEYLVILGCAWDAEHPHRGRP
jgi:hypothetical protein